MTTLRGTRPATLLLPDVTHTTGFSRMIKALFERVLPRKTAVRKEHSGKALGIRSEHMSGNAVYVCEKLQRAAGEDGAFDFDAAPGLEQH